MKWIYVIAMAAFVAGSCTLRSADTPLMSGPDIELSAHG